MDSATIPQAPPISSSRLLVGFFPSSGFDQNMNVQLDFAALNTCLRGLEHLFIDIGRLTPEAGYEEQIGGYGTVRVSTLDSDSGAGGVLVAAKTIRLKDRHKEPKRLAFRLARELKIWAGFRHPHVLLLMGYYLDKDYRIAVLISRYMIHGDLKEYIDKQKPGWDARLHLVCDLTDGLAYLHRQTPPVLHGDIKMKNVLVSETIRGILADFGLSKALEDGPTGLTTSDGLKGTLRCYSPELIRDQDSSHSLPSDIWAWGCLVLEALADKIPYAEKKSEHSIIRALMNGEPPSDTERLSFPVPDLKSLLTRCWTIQPLERPSALDCLRGIESALSTPRPAADIQSITTPLHSLQESSPPAESTSGAVEARIQLHATQLQNDQQSHKGLPTLPLQLVQLFWYRFRTYLDERHAPLELVIIEGKVVELHQLFFIVGALGGWLAVREKQLWPFVGARLGLLDSDGKDAPQSRLTLAERLFEAYQRTLADFETRWRDSLGPTDPDSIFPLPLQLQFLHPEIKELSTIQPDTDLESRGPRTPQAGPQRKTDAGARPGSLILGGSESLEPLPEHPSRQEFVEKAKHIVARALAILESRPLPTFQKYLPRKQTSEEQPLSNGEYGEEDVAKLLIEAGELQVDSSEIRDIVDLEIWADGWDHRASAMIAGLHEASPNRPSDKVAWDALFFEAYSHNYRLQRFEEVGKVVKRIRLLEELHAVQGTALTMEDVEELQKQAVDCNLPSDNKQVIYLKQLAERGTQWCKYARMVLDTPIIALEDLNKLVTPPYSVPAYSSLLERIDSVRGHARGIEKRAKAILYPSGGSRTPITEAVRFICAAQKDFLIPAVQILAELAPQAAHIEKTCFDIINTRYSPEASHKPLFEELRDMRYIVQKKLWMFAIPSFDVVDQQLVQHDAWLEKLPWYRTPAPAMQGKLIADDVVQNTRREDDKPPLDPECTCICTLPVKNTAENQVDAFQCDHCGAKFHPKCIEGSCPFCDHHHWNGSLTRTRSFEYIDLLPIAREAPDLTRNYSLTWKHLEIIITYVDRLSRAIDTFLVGFHEQNTNTTPPHFIPQTRHFLRKLYKMQFSIKPRADMPSYGLTLCHVHFVLANNAKASQDASQKIKAHRRPKFIFTAEVMPLAGDGSRCLCKGSHVGHRLTTCNSCSYNFHWYCVRYDEGNNPTSKPWRCPMCMIRKGKQYPQSAVRVRTVAEQGPDIYIDTKACLENYSWELIRKRLPPPTDYTIILELERFVPGSNQYPESSPAAKLPALAPQLQSSAGSFIPIPQKPSPTPKPAAPSGSASTSGSASQPSAASGSSSSSSRAAMPSPAYIAPNASKRKAATSPAAENPRRVKLLFREGDKAADEATSRADRPAA